MNECDDLCGAKAVTTCSCGAFLCAGCHDARDHQRCRELDDAAEEIR